MGKFTKEQLLEIYQKECVENKLKYSQVKEKYGIPRGTWDYHIRKRGGFKADTRTYKANDTFFDVIDSEEKAYLLGFLYADGYLANDGRMGIRLQIDDIEIIKLIQKYICPDTPIQYTNNQNFKRKPQCSIRWKSNRMYNRLKELGFCIDKTHTDSNIFTLIPDDFKRHFLRGYTDGDGHISAYHLDNVYKRKIDICWCNGCSRILKDIQEYFTGLHSILYDNKTYYTLYYNHYKECNYIIRLLYTNCTLYLSRKKKSADDVINYFDNTVLSN